MSKKSLGAAEDCPLQCVIAEPITDPAEQAALDKASQTGKAKAKGTKAKMNRNNAKTPSNSAAKRRA